MKSKVRLARAALSRFEEQQERAELELANMEGTYIEPVAGNRMQAALLLAAEGYSGMELEPTLSRMTSCRG